MKCEGCKKEIIVQPFHLKGHCASCEYLILSALVMLGGMGFFALATIIDGGW